MAENSMATARVLRGSGGRDSRLFGGGHGDWLFGWLFCMNRKDVCVDRGGRVDRRTGKCCGPGRGIKEISGKDSYEGR